MAKTKWPPSEWRPRVKNTTNFCNQKGCKCMYITYKYYKSYNKVISVNNLNFGPVSVVVQIKLKFECLCVVYRATPLLNSRPSPVTGACYDYFFPQYSLSSTPKEYQGAIKSTRGWGESQQAPVVQWHICNSLYNLQEITPSSSPHTSAYPSSPIKIFRLTGLN